MTLSSESFARQGWTRQRCPSEGRREREWRSRQSRHAGSSPCLLVRERRAVVAVQVVRLTHRGYGRRRILNRADLVAPECSRIVLNALGGDTVWTQSTLELR